MSQPNRVTAAFLLTLRAQFDFGCPVVGCPRTYNRPDNVQRHCSVSHQAIYHQYRIPNNTLFDFSRVVLIAKPQIQQQQQQQAQQAPHWPREWEQEMEEYFRDSDSMDCPNELEQQQPSFDEMDWMPELEDQQPRGEADDLEEELEGCYQVSYWWSRDEGRWVVFDQWWTWSARSFTVQRSEFLCFGIPLSAC